VTGGAVDINFDETTPQLNRLRSAGQDLDRAWKKEEGTITAPARIGGGPLGQAFQKTVAATDTLRSTVDGVPGFYTGAADTGDRAVAQYRAGSTAATAQFGS
jgi:hypothetical protein